MSGGRWGAVRSIALQGASIITTAVLARFLSDEDFGIVAITVVVLTMFDLITRVGLGASVIRQRELTQRSMSTFFWASMALGFTAGGLAALISTPAAALAGSVDAAPLVVVAALTIPINLGSRVPSGLINRELRFRTAALIDIAGSITHGIVAVSLAWSGFGAWSVVIGQVCRAVVIMTGSFAATRFRPTFEFDRRLIRKEISFNVGWLGGDLVGYANKNADYWFVGNRLGTGPLGIYYVAYVIPTILRQRVSAIGHEVLYPVVARIQDDRQRVAAAYLRVVRLVSFLVVPAMLGLAVVADLAVKIGFGDDWLEAIGPLRVIAVAAAVTAMTVVANPVFPAMGKPVILIVTGLSSLLALAIGLAFSFNEGTLVAVALAVLGAALTEGSVILRKVSQMLGVGIGTFLRTVSPFVVSAGAMALVVWLARTLVLGSVGIYLEALLAVPLGGATYLAVGRLVFREQFTSQLGAVKTLVGAGSRS